MRYVNKPQDLWKISSISIFSMLLRCFYVNCYLFGGEEILISETGIFQLYFGGLLLEQSFDLIAISLQMLIILLETVVLVSDLHNGMIENLAILICRVSNKKKLYRNFIRHILLRDMLLVTFDYVLFLLLEQTMPDIAQIHILLTHFLLIVLLELIYFTLDFVFKIVYGYVFMLLIFFSPIIFIGFMYATGNDLWQIGKNFVFQYGIYNWFHGLTIVYVENDIKWNVISYHINCFIPFFAIAMLFLGLYTIGKLYFQKLEII